MYFYFHSKKDKNWDFSFSLLFRATSFHCPQSLHLKAKNSHFLVSPQFWITPPAVSNQQIFFSSFSRHQSSVFKSHYALLLNHFIVWNFRFSSWFVKVDSSHFQAGNQTVLLSCKCTHKANSTCHTFESLSNFDAWSILQLFQCIILKSYIKCNCL